MIGALAHQKWTWDEDLRKTLKWQPEFRLKRGANGQEAGRKSFWGWIYLMNMIHSIARLIPEKVEMKWTVVRKGRWSGEFDMNTLVVLQMDYEIETRKRLDSMGWRK
jgi:nitrogen fixation protein FixH